MHLEGRTFAGTRVFLPRIALGCGNFGGIGSAPEFFGHRLREEAFTLMDAAWALGLRHFDTADAYGGGRSEEIIGRWIRARGRRPIITTKTFHPMRAGDDHGLAADRIRRQLETRPASSHSAPATEWRHRLRPAGGRLAGRALPPR